MRTLAVILLCAVLCACEREYRWVPPPGTAGRQVNQDFATCRGAAGDPGPFVGGGLMGAAVVDQITDNFVSCMQRAGYTQVPTGRYY